MDNSKLKNVVLTAMFAALIFLGTFIIRIPIPATSGYIHFGDGFIYVAAMVLPLPFAAAAGAIGGFLSDMLAGYMFYAPWTAIIKALMSVVVVLIFRHSFIDKNFVFKKNIGRALAATVLAGIVNVGGYFIVECFMYTPAGALASVPMNCLQSIFGVVIFFIISPIFSRILKTLYPNKK
ncbi:ECF transporter S component [Pectinatus sottacetonis]|uniref:ECF transporter S component n=1 Tax=Pectinatus sottacetonis TaxID=1002795 RepID=UPI0018C68924|nr:ECF transporter S component [Pectinatus sottacetonis]